MTVTDQLDSLFPDHRSPERADDWESVKQRFARGQAVGGTVVLKSPFGAWIDVGVGFPALLSITVIAGLTPERYRSDDWCPIGSVIEAFIGGFSDDRRQIGLWQVEIGSRQRD